MVKEATAEVLVVWIAFNEPKVLAYLRANGEVYTVRHYPAAEPYVRPVRRYRELTGESVRLETIAQATEGGEVVTAALEAVVGASGFGAVQEWKDAITRQHATHIRDGKQLWLLRATLLASQHA